MPAAFALRVVSRSFGAGKSRGISQRRRAAPTVEIAERARWLAQIESVQLARSSIFEPEKNLHPAVGPYRTRIGVPLIRLIRRSEPRRFRECWTGDTRGRKEPGKKEEFFFCRAFQDAERDDIASLVRSALTVSRFFSFLGMAPEVIRELFGVLIVSEKFELWSCIVEL